MSENNDYALQKNRFLVRFPEYMHIPEWCVKNVSRFSIFPEKSKCKCGNIEITLRIGVDMSILESITNAFSHKKRFFKKKVHNNFLLQYLKPNGECAYDLILSDCELVSMRFSDSSYDDDDILDLILEIKPSYCTFKTKF